MGHASRDAEVFTQLVYSRKVFRSNRNRQQKHPALHPRHLMLRLRDPQDHEAWVKIAPQQFRHGRAGEADAEKTVHGALLNGRKGTPYIFLATKRPWQGVSDEESRRTSNRGNKSGESAGTSQISAPGLAPAANGSKPNGFLPAAERRDIKYESPIGNQFPELHS
jgi:hypothetical protein